MTHTLLQSLAARRSAPSQSGSYKRKCSYLVPSTRPFRVHSGAKTWLIAIELVSDSVRSVLEPSQVAVRTPYGCEATVPTTRRHRSDPSRVAAAIDISNVFNTVDRSALLGSFVLISYHRPVGRSSCYRYDSTLLTETHCITSAREVQQGDPFVPVLFALVVRPAVIVTNRAADRTSTLSSLDDGLVSGSAPAIGSVDWCDSLLARRVTKALSLLEVIGRHPDAQAAFCLLCSCAGWAEILYSWQNGASRRAVGCHELRG